MILFPLFNNGTWIACDILIPTACTSGTLQEDNKSDITEQNLTIFKTPRTPFLLRKTRNIDMKESGVHRTDGHGACQGRCADTHRTGSKNRQLFDLQQLDIKDQLRVGGNAGESLLAVRKVGGDGDAALATDSHAGDTDIPTLDDLTLAQLEGEGLALLVSCEGNDVSEKILHEQCVEAREPRNIQSKTLPSSSLPM